MSPRQQALLNGSRRPIKTSPANPYAARSTRYGEVRVSPKIALLKARGASHGVAQGMAESKANYMPKAAGKAEIRAGIADMVRRHRATGELSMNIDTERRLTRLNAKLSRVVEFGKASDKANYKNSMTQDELARRSHLLRGAAIGAGVGALGSGVLAYRLPKNPVGAFPLVIGGAGVGGTLGASIGAHIDKKHPDKADPGFKRLARAVYINK